MTSGRWGEVVVVGSCAKFFLTADQQEFMILSASWGCLRYTLVAGEWSKESVGKHTERWSELGSMMSLA